MIAQKTRIEKAREKDFPHMAELVLEEFSYVNASRERLVKRFSEHPEIFMFKLSDRKGIAGFLELQLREEKARINALVVKKGFRGKGLGKRLLEFGIDFLKKQNISEVMLNVKQDNVHAKNIYALYGFESRGVIPNKIIDGAPIEKMKLNLERGLEEEAG
ncbi:MAG: GNAT family N-acetyltransferase [Candidatus Diapherotrites archaeon]